MNNAIQIFENKQFGKIRTLINEKGETWFVAKDLALALGYAKTRNAVAEHVSSEDKTTALIQGPGSNYKSQTVLVNESGLYTLIFGSKLPSAKAFKRWVTSEVLPKIRNFHYFGLGGVKKQRPYLVWTAEGLEFIKGLIDGILVSETRHPINPTLNEVQCGDS